MGGATRFLIPGADQQNESSFKSNHDNLNQVNAGILLMQIMHFGIFGKMLVIMIRTTA